ncbi:hypothetical protein DYST_00001 [Dyella terrae]|nr:hypothetical protein DYST_00001 [Dyella terrae]
MMDAGMKSPGVVNTFGVNVWADRGLAWPSWLGGVTEEDHEAY